jgi:para-aminobenzoate synthetase component 1
MIPDFMPKDYFCSMTSRIALNGNENNWLIGVGEADLLEIDSNFQAHCVDAFLDQHKGFHLFSILSYDLGFELLPTVQQVKNRNFPLIRFWKANAVYTFDGTNLTCVEGDHTPENERCALDCVQQKTGTIPHFEWSANQSKAEYIQAVSNLKNHIQQGNIYEINYCQAFAASLPENANVLAMYHRLNDATTTPFSVLFESDRFAMACASPERFIKKTGDRLISQPIKGTAPRGATADLDAALRDNLVNNPKERAENIMIVDLVRNDCSRLATKGSVHVDELCGLYSFPTVHQLISTVSCTIRPETTFSNILSALFPMGSMTGAPKIAAINLAESTEKNAREWYSGSVGVVYPSGDFDFNVVIRSLIFDRLNQSVSVGVGGAITIHSDPYAEYEECKVKVGKILSLFGSCQW